MPDASLYNARVGKRDNTKRSLLALTVACTLAAALFGFGAEVFAFQSVYEGSGREGVILISRLLAYLALALLLVFKGGWWGVLAAVAMTVGATAAEWALIPAAKTWAGLSDPAGYAERFGIGRPMSYPGYATFDVLGVGIAAAFARGLIMMAHVNPRGPRDE